MKQLDLFEKEMNWPNDFDGVHQIGGSVGFGTSHPGYGAVPPKIYESPDGGKTVYARNFGETERYLVKSSVQQQWTITFNGEPV